MSTIATAEERAAGRSYEELFVPAEFSIWTKHLIAAAQIEPGDTVLDIACGTGVLARAALAQVGAEGRVTGIDPAPGMLAVAAEEEPAVDWVAGAAENLPFADGTFDAVVSQFGMMFFADRAAAAREMHRVLRPGGRLAVAVWDALERQSAYIDIVAAIEEIVGPAAGRAMRLPFSLGDASAVVDVYAAAGFGGVEVTTLGETATFPDARTLVEADLRGWLPLFDIHPDEPTIAAVVDRVAPKVARYAAASGAITFPTSAHVVAGRKG